MTVTEAPALVTARYVMFIFLSDVIWGRGVDILNVIRLLVGKFACKLQ